MSEEIDRITLMARKNELMQLQIQIIKRINEINIQLGEN